MGMRRPRRVSLDHRGGGAAAPGYRVIEGFVVGVLISIRFVPVRDDFQTAEFLTADGADSADKGRKISDYPRYLRNPRLNALVGSLVAAESRVARYGAWRKKTTGVLFPAYAPTHCPT